MAPSGQVRCLLRYIPSAEFDLCVPVSASGRLGYFWRLNPTISATVSFTLLTVFGHSIRTSMPARRLCLSLRRACFIEPTQTSVIFGLEDTSSPDLLSHSLFGTFILTSKSFSPSLSVTLYLRTTRVGLLVFHSGLGITYLHCM